MRKTKDSFRVRSSPSVYLHVQWMSVWNMSPKHTSYAECWTKNLFKYSSHVYGRENLIIPHHLQRLLVFKSGKLRLLYPIQRQCPAIRPAGLRISIKNEYLPTSASLSNKERVKQIYKAGKLHVHKAAGCGNVAIMKSCAAHKISLLQLLAVSTLLHSSYVRKAQALPTHGVCGYRPAQSMCQLYLPAKACSDSAVLPVVSVGWDGLPNRTPMQLQPQWGPAPLQGPLCSPDIGPSLQL